jgi:TonB family protein
MCVPQGAAGLAEASAKVSTRHLAAIKVARGWRFARISSADLPFLGLPRVGRDASEPKRVKQVRPVYTEVARNARVQGLVVLDCVISPEGHVTRARVLRGIPVLDQAAIDAVKQWQYAPTVLGGQAVSVAMTITVEFRLP